MFKVYRRGAARRAWRMGCRSHASSSPPALPPEAASSAFPPPRLRQFRFGRQHARSQAREPPTHASIRFLLAGRSGCFTLQEQRSGCKTLLFSPPGFSPTCLAHKSDTDSRSVLTGAGLHLWCELGLGSRVGWLLCPTCSIAQVASRSEGSGSGSNISVPGRGLACRAGLSGAPGLSLELFLSPRTLPLCIFSNFPP